MIEEVNEPVSVLVAFNPPYRGAIRVVPQLMRWRGRRCRLEQMGLYFSQRRGAKQIHSFSFLSEGRTFRIELDPQTLEWTLAAVYDEA